MKRASILVILLLPLLMTGANTGSGSAVPCNCGESIEDTLRLQKMMDAKVDSLVEAKLALLEEIKRDLLDTMRPLYLGQVDIIPEPGNIKKIHRWYFRIQGTDTLFVKRTVTTVK